MNSKFLRICSMILTIVMVFNMLPMQALGEMVFTEEQTISATNESISADATVTNSTASAEIVEEIEENRTEYTKEFKLSNGLHMAVVYGDPVHYENNGKWDEIDNTLKATTKGTYTNTAGVWEVALPQQMTANSPVTITKDGYTLSFVLAGELNKPSDAVVMSEQAELSVQGNLSLGNEEDGAQTFALATTQTATAQPQDLGIAEAKAAAKYPETVSDKLSSRLLYADVYPNTNITYDLTSNKVKESIILEQYDTELRGYKYTLNVGNLVPVLGEDGHIDFYNEDQSEIVMVMPAPYLIDAGYAYNEDIEVQLAGKGSTYVLTYLLPQSWLAEEGRRWPVILDPVVDATNTAANIQDHEVAERATVAVNRGVMEAGYGANGGIERFFIKYNELPTLKAADVIVHAQITLKKPYNYATSAVIEAHLVEEDWSENTLTWAQQPEWSTEIEDYLVVEDAGDYTWEITDIVRSWYENGNTGMMFKASDAVEIAQETNWMQFYSSDCGFNSGIPALKITYQSFNGLEDGWSYTSASAGRAGTGAVNNYTGALTWTHSDIGFDGNRTPVSISHVYNSNDIEETDRYGTGIGWKTSLNQRVYPMQDDDQNKYFVWIDGDGTSHYLRLKYRGYVDENNPQIVFNLVNADDVYFYRMELGNGLRYFFDRYLRLTVIQDFQETSSITRITYPSLDSYKISAVTDGAGRKYTYNYNTEGLLDHISYTGSGTTEVARVSFTYDSAGHLTDITDIDGKQSHFTYENSLLTGATEYQEGTQTKGLNLQYTYSQGKFKRVTQIEEFDNTTPGGHIELAYAHNLTTLTDKVNNISQIMRFNDFGNVISVQDELGRAQHAEYTRMDKDDTGAGNQLRLSSKLQNTVKNYISHHNFEMGSIITSGTAQTTIETAYMGDMSMKTTSTVSTQSYSVAAGESYTLSAWVKTDNTTAKLTISDAQSTVLKENSDWTRLEVTYTNNTGETQMITPRMVTANNGNFAYMDCVQLEKAAAASRYNLLESGDLTSLSKWTASGFENSDGIVQDTSAAPQLDNKVLKLTGDPEGQKSISQTLNISGDKGDAFVLAGWARGSSVPLTDDRAFGLELTFNYTETVDEPKDQKVDFNPDTDDGWQYAAAAMVAEEAYDSVTVTLRYDYNANTVYFDGIQLFKEVFGSSYTYDENGNVVTTTDLQQQKTTYAYSNNDLTKVVMPNGSELKYTYDGYHNVLTATTAEGQRYSFTYDRYGNNTKVSTVSGGKTLQSTATYTADGNYPVTVTDALGNTTTYSYDSQTGMLNWVQGPKDTEQTRTEYTYDPDTFLLESVEAVVDADLDLDPNNTTDNTLNMSVEYTYNDGLLQIIDTPSTEYGFNYGVFDLQQNVTIGGRTLVTYNYSNDRNYDLTSLDYGNGDGVQYSYDKYGRLLAETYEDTDTVSYYYDNDGALVAVHDSASGITSRQYYDLSGRNVGYSETAEGFTHTVGYKYNSDNNLIELTEDINGAERTTTYEYDDDNRTTEITTNGTTVAYTYDGFGRVTQQVTKIKGENEETPDTVILTEYFTYTAPTAATTSGQVATYRTVGGNYDITYSYTYDKNGNIRTVSDGTNTTTYSYDGANQLIREDNQAKGKSYIWIYDAAGNIRHTEEFAYTDTETQLTRTKDTDTNTYGSQIWGDLLTAYNGTAIQYDGVGNPVVHGSTRYAWEHGRQLAAMTRDGGTTTWNYTYNNAGLRTGRYVQNGTAYKYVYNGGQLMQMTKDNQVVSFAYDAGGTPLTMKVGENTYYYVTNIQGDVMALVNASGATVVSYAYTAYGVVSITDGENTTAAALNPLTYRGYVYDSETGLYYLQSRYYDPAIGRFINADGLVSTGQGFTGNNMFAYCGNNPVMGYDPSGEFNWRGVVAGLAIAAVGVLVVAAAVATGGTSLAATGAVITVAKAATATVGVAVAATGAVTTYGAATDTPVVYDLSYVDAKTHQKKGYSVVADFSSDSIGIDSYYHEGVTTTDGYSTSYGVGLVSGYEDAGDYGGHFVDANFSYNHHGADFGYDQCADPTNSNGCRAAMITIGVSGGCEGDIDFNFGYDYYYPISYKEFRWD